MSMKLQWQKNYGQAILYLKVVGFNLLIQGGDSLDEVISFVPFDTEN